MSKAQEEEEEEEDSERQKITEEGEEIFHESLDRILSSANSSTSNSDDDDVVFPSPSPRRFSIGNHHRRRHGKPSSCSPKFPMSARNYDVWVSSESFSLASLEQRRDRLLRALGLSSDPSLSRRKSVMSHEFGQSSSFGHLGSSVEHNPALASSGRVINGSKSEGSDDLAGGGGGGGGSNLVRGDQCNSSCSSSFASILSVRSVSDTVNSYSDFKYNGADNNSCNGVVVSNLVGNGYGDSVSNKLPRPSWNSGCRGVAEVLSDCSVGGYNGVEMGDRVCRIKNLDNGKEFVVNEVREDGTWDKLKEVGTGRQLTMEEFEMCVGHSPIVQELMRRQSVEDQRDSNAESNGSGDGNGNGNGSGNANGENAPKSKKKVSWLRSIKNVASSVTGYMERRSSDEKDSFSERGGRRSSSATDDSHDGSFNGAERVRVRQYGKSVKDLTALYKSQEIQAHNGSIWTIKFSLDGRHLASAGEDCVIHVWQVVESERKGELLIDIPDDGNLNMLLLTNGSPEPLSASPSVETPLERRRRRGRKSVSLDHIAVPESVFALSEKPICSFQGHSDDVLDLSWSKSQLLLSSSMDKTVRLWNLSSKTCVKIFTHSDYVTCIQFNPVDDKYFISGSLDAKVRIWSIPDRQVVDWNDLHEMVTAACYTPDGQGALVGSYKGSCRLYNTSENKLQLKCLINLQNKKKRSHLKKITGFQFAPGSSSEVLITSADSRVRIINGVDLVHKFKGFRNTNSQISGSLTANGKYMVCASEDSHVYMWKLEGDSRPSRSKGVTVTHSYEYFHCQNVSVAIPWPGMGELSESPELCSPEQNGSSLHLDEVMTANHPPTPVEEFNDSDRSPGAFGCSNSPFHGVLSSAPSGYFFDRISATWPEEKLLSASKNQKLLLTTKNWSPRASLDFSNGVLQNTSAWGMVVVTAGVRGEIRTFQNFGLPVRL